MPVVSQNPAAGGGGSQPGLQVVAATDPAGYDFSGGNNHVILSYTTPDDGELHPVVIAATFLLTVVGIAGPDVRFDIEGVSQVGLIGSGVWAGGSWFSSAGSGGTPDLPLTLPGATTVRLLQDGAAPDPPGAGVVYAQILSA